MNTQVADKYRLISRTSNTCERIALTILFQVVHWEKDALSDFSVQYRRKVRLWMAGDKKTIGEMNKVISDTNLEIEIETDRYHKDYVVIANTWRSCLKIILSLLQNSQDDPSKVEGLRTVASCFGDCVKAYNENEADALELMKQTMDYIGIDDDLFRKEDGDG